MYCRFNACLLAADNGHRAPDRRALYNIYVGKNDIEQDAELLCKGGNQRLGNTTFGIRQLDDPFSGFECDSRRTAFNQFMNLF